SAFQSTLPARLQRGEAGLRPQLRLWPLVRFTTGLASKPQSAPPPACRWTGLAPHASLPAKLVAVGSGLFWWGSKRGTRAAPRTPRQWRGVGSPMRWVANSNLRRDSSSTDAGDHRGVACDVDLSAYSEPVWWRSRCSNF